MTDLVCISHLRWDFVWQRPQHLLSRFGKTHHVYFVEEPVTVAPHETARLDIRQEANNVTVIRLLFPTEHGGWIGHGDARTAELYEELLTTYLADHHSARTLLWLYTPMAFHFIATLTHDILIYDVMDELAAFKNAPAELSRYDQTILAQADIVFTGGMSLYESRRSCNTNTHLFPSGVEIEHFASAADRTMHLCPDDIAHIAPPILGYYGVIDERMDMALLAQVAANHPEWNIVLVGPLAKIGWHELPQAPNLHYPGQKSYQELPQYLAHFDVALIPFALNESTLYLSPTKTLEYMAAHKPIISTPIPDVVKSFSGIVHFATTPEAFAAQVNTALNRDSVRSRAREREIVQQYTWDDIVKRMNQLIHSTMEHSGVQLLPKTQSKGMLNEQRAGA